MIQIQLEPEIEARLTAEAQARSLTPESYAEQLITERGSADLRFSGPRFVLDSRQRPRTATAAVRATCLVKRDHAQYPLVRGAVGTLRQTGVKLGYTLQNMAEFWNASTPAREEWLRADRRGDRKKR